MSQVIEAIWITGLFVIPCPNWIKKGDKRNSEIKDSFQAKRNSLFSLQESISFYVYICIYIYI